MEDVTKTKVVTVETFSDPVLAKIIKAKLEAAGIECFLTDENTVTLLYNQALGGVRLKVLEEDLEKAREIIAESSTMEETAVDEGPHCPYCNSTDTVVSLGHEGTLAAVWSLFLSSLPLNSKQHYVCQSCGKTFKKKIEPSER